MILFTIVWLVGLCTHIWIHKKHKDTWNNRKRIYRVVSNSLGFSAGIIMLSWAIVLNNRERTEAENDILARENYYASLDSALIFRVDSLGSLVKDMPQPFEMSNSLDAQLLENGIPQESKVFAAVMDSVGVKKIWIDFNKMLMQNGKYSDEPDSIDYIILITSYEQTTYYGNTKLLSSTCEHAFVHVIDFHTSHVADTLIFNSNRNPTTMAMKKRGTKTYHKFIAVDQKDIFSKLFRNKQ